MDKRKVKNSPSKEEINKQTKMLAALEYQQKQNEYQKKTNEMI